MNPADAENNWFCVQTRIGLEARTSEALSRLSADIHASIGDLEVYCPQIRTPRKISGRMQTATTPLFPGYIFARFCPSTAGRFVASRPGVVGLVTFGASPAALSATTIEELKSMDFDNTLGNRFPSFVPGQRLVIREGPFAGMEAEYVSSLKGGARALLFLDYLQRRVNLMAEIEMLTPAD